MDDPKQWLWKAIAWLLIHVPSGGNFNELPSWAKPLARVDPVVCWVHILTRRERIMPRSWVSEWECLQQYPPEARTRFPPPNTVGAVNLIRANVHGTPFFGWKPIEDKQ